MQHDGFDIHPCVCGRASKLSECGLKEEDEKIIMSVPIIHFETNNNDCYCVPTVRIDLNDTF